MIGELQDVAQKVSRLASQNEEDEEMLGDAPEEFLDPIMSTLMIDPVILPSSKQIVDRTTIARYDFNGSSGGDLLSLQKMSSSNIFLGIF